MAKKKIETTPIAKPNDHWITTTEIQINGRHVVPGTELKISGQRGRFRFVKHVNTGSSEWIDVLGGTKGFEQQWRSFFPKDVKVVHSKKKTDPNLAKEFKVKRKKQLQDLKEQK